MTRPIFNGVKLSLQFPFMIACGYCTPLLLHIRDKYLPLLLTVHVLFIHSRRQLNSIRWTIGPLHLHYTLASGKVLNISLNNVRYWLEFCGVFDREAVCFWVSTRSLILEVFHYIFITRQSVCHQTCTYINHLGITKFSITQLQLSITPNNRPNTYQ